MTRFSRVEDLRVSIFIALFSYEFQDGSLVLFGPAEGDFEIFPMLPRPAGSRSNVFITNAQPRPPATTFGTHRFHTTQSRPMMEFTQADNLSRALSPAKATEKPGSRTTYPPLAVGRRNISEGALSPVWSKTTFISKIHAQARETRGVELIPLHRRFRLFLVQSRLFTAPPHSRGLRGSRRRQRKQD